VVRSQPGFRDQPISLGALGAAGSAIRNIKKLPERNRVLRHLREHHGELFTEYETVLAAETV
jgi:hypothetical protein